MATAQAKKSARRNEPVWQQTFVISKSEDGTFVSDPSEATVHVGAALEWVYDGDGELNVNLSQDAVEETTPLKVKKNKPAKAKAKKQQSYPNTYVCTISAVSSGSKSLRATSTGTRGPTIIIEK